MLKVIDCPPLTSKRLRMTGNVVSRPHSIGNEKGDLLESPQNFSRIFQTNEKVTT